MEALLEQLEAAEVERLVIFTDARSGLRAFLALHDLTLGPAAGGIRTWSYDTSAEAVADACRLARAMTVKCALAGLPAGGGKLVVMDRPELDRAAAFRTLGDQVDAMGGKFLTAGDMGTTAADLAIMAQRTEFVRTDGADLVAAVGRGIVGCVRIGAAMAGLSDVSKLRIAVQGCGVIGSAVARALDAAGGRLIVADFNASAAAELAHTLDAEVADPADILSADVDVLSPCAAGGVLDAEAVRSVRAPVVCGAANNILASDSAGDLAHELGIVVVPDAIASAGAVVHGVCDFVGSDRADELIDGLGETARAVLSTSQETGVPPTRVATRMAADRLAARQP